MLCLIFHDCSVTTYLYFLIPSPFLPFLPTPFHLATVKMFFVPANLFLFYLCILESIFKKKILFIDFREREGKREKQKLQFVVPLIDTLIGWFLYMAWLGIEPTTLEYWDDALTNWATWPGLDSIVDRYVCCPFIVHIFDPSSPSSSSSSFLKKTL